ncbi:S8 family serine peptidase [Streptomyces sp. NPDC059454]|uniref:S8 family peptidase n=1 Tax=Streptomyces sp. NPDC059454 TaxID=3346836 RepID=UPI00368DEC6A
MTHQMRTVALKVTAAACAVTAATTAALLGASSARAAEPAHGAVIGLDAEGAVAGSYLVLLDEKTTSAGEKDLAREYGGRLSRSYGAALDGFAAAGLSESEAERLAADPAVGAVVANRTLHATATQDGPPSWGLDRVDQEDTAGDGKYTYPDKAGEGVTAYVIDTGVRVTHKDFEGRASHGYDAVDDDGTADDGNGHGTHVAATLAGAAHGVAKKADVVAVRVLDDNGSGTTEQVIAGIDWVTENHKGPSVANMSLGGAADPALDAAVGKAVASGVTFAVAAGNESADAGQGSPARVPEALTVASSTEDDAQSDFSNFGTAVDLYAPGSDITSAWNDSDEGTRTISGTSMASPHVAGAAAVYLAGHPVATPAAVATALTGTATTDRIGNPGTGTPNKLLKITE